MKKLISSIFIMLIAISANAKSSIAKEYFYYANLTGLLNAPCENAPFCDGSSTGGDASNSKIAISIDAAAKFNSVGWTGEISVPFSLNIEGEANVNDVVMSSTLDIGGVISKIEFTGTGANRTAIITKGAGPLSEYAVSLHASLEGKVKDTAVVNIQLAGNCNNPIDADGHVIYCDATGDTYLLSSVDDLLHISKNQSNPSISNYILNGKFELTNDISFPSYSSVDWDGDGSLDHPDVDAGWIPLGVERSFGGGEAISSIEKDGLIKVSFDKVKRFFSIANSYAIGQSNPGEGPFEGEFDGRNYSIKNIYINRGSDRQGFFGSIDNATIKNLNIENSNIFGYRMVGALAGYAERSTIDNCSSSGKVNANNSRTGGLVGEAHNTTISNSSSGAVLEEYVRPSGEKTEYVSYDAGGLVGRSFDSNISDCYATGSVKAEVLAGGLVGSIESITVISNSYATGDVNSKSSAGGLIGSSYGDITNCYATGNVSGEYAVGGLVASSASNISSSYATGNVVSDNKQEFSDPGMQSTFSAVAGGLVGHLNGSNKISSSYATGNVSSKFDGVFNPADQPQPISGGLVGALNGNGIVEDSYATGSIKAETSLVDSYAGGLVGKILNGGTVKNSYSNGSVLALVSSSHTAYAGGLVGVTQDKDYVSSAKIINSYASWSSAPSAGSSASSKLGGLLGGITPLTSGTTTITNVNNKCAGMSESTVSSCSVDDAKIIKTTWNDAKWEKLEDLSPKLEWETSGDVSSDLPEPEFACDVNTFWSVLEKESGGFGPPTYLIGGSAGNSDLAKKQLLCLSKFSNNPPSPGALALYKLTANVDFGAPNSVDWDSSGVVGDAGDANGWIPMGTQANPFESVIDGNNKTISNLYINRNAPYQGLIGYADNTFVEKLTLNNVNIDAQQSGNISGEYIGSVAGYAKASTFQNITVNVNSIKGYNYVGGLVGKAIKSDSYQTEILFATVNSGDVYAENDFVGGISGSLHDSLIENSSVSSDIECDHYSAGGLVGYLKGKIEKSYATGTIDGYKYTGGLVGRQSSSPTIDVHVKSSYATGNVTASNDYIGGLIGYISDGDGGTSTVEKSYATGSVTSSSDEYAGGLIGYSKDTGVIKNCYASGDVINSAKYVGGLIGYSNATITNCYATGGVTGSDSRIGGFIGYASSSSDITNSYANWTMAPSGPSYVGGLIGRISSSGITLDNESGLCEYINETGSPSSCSSGNISTIQGGSSYGAWDSSIWNLTGSSPTLKNMP